MRRPRHAVVLLLLVSGIVVTADESPRFVWRSATVLQDMDTRICYGVVDGIALGSVLCPEEIAARAQRQRDDRAVRAHVRRVIQRAAPRLSATEVETLVAQFFRYTWPGPGMAQ